MTIYTAEVQMPEIFKTFYETIAGRALLAEFNPSQNTFIISFDENDEYELAQTVHELGEELLSASIWVDIPRPRKA